MALLQVQLLGDFRLSYAGETLTTLNAERPQSLLAYLLLHRHAPQPRHYLAFQLWPDSSESQARSNLRNLLHSLRHTLPNADTFLLTDAQTLQWNPQAPFTLDVADFEKALTCAEQTSDPAAVRRYLEEAITAYGGDLLPGNYDDWLSGRREELRRQQIDALHKLIRLLEQAGDYRTALRYTQRLLQQDVLDEASYVLQMRLYAFLGERAAIRRVYQSCVEVLARELEVDPSPTTQAAYEQYLRLPSLALPTALPDRTALAAGTPDATPSAVTAESMAPEQPCPLLVNRPRALPTPRTTFLGRRRELAEIALRLADSACRLITVTGPGGVGKTRLALESAKGHQPVFADGVAFVPLAPLEAVEQIITALADALNLTSQEMATPKEQILYYLRPKTMLLVLDNFEHLLDGTELLSTILDEAAGLKLLVTSRERLNLQEEWIFELGGLPVLAEQTAYGEEQASVALFLQSAQRVRPDFSPTPADQEAIRQICQLVDGMPLGIELAATWVRILACPEIVHEIQRSLDFLSTTLRNLPARHRSLRAVFDQSWGLMTAQEQQVFRQLACFRGGFTRAAAEQVVGATLPMLATLADKSLLQQMSSGRFGLHQLLHHYAQERLEEAGETATTRQQHLCFFLAYAEGDGPTYVRSPAWLAQIAAEYENLWMALQWAATGGTVESGLRLAFSLHVYWEMRGYWREEYEWLTRLLALPTAGPPTLIRARVLTHAGKSAQHLVDAATAVGYYTTSLAIARQHQSVPDMVMALIGLGDSQQEHAVARTYYTESLALSRDVGFREGEARALTCLGHLASGAGDYAGATALYQEALAIQQALGDQLAATGLLRNLGIGAFTQQAYQQAETIYEECLRTYRTLGNQPGVVAVLNDLADVALAYGNYEKANLLYGESLSRAYELGSKWNIAWSFESLARVAVSEEAYARAAFLFGAAEHLFQHISARLRLDDMTEHERLVAIVRANLPPQTFAAQRQQGAHAPIEQAMTCALESSNTTATLPHPAA